MKATLERKPHLPQAGSWPQSFVNPRDGSLLRLVPAGAFTMGSTLEDLERARALDRDGSRFPLSHEPFALSHETPQFQLFVPAFYIGVFAVTNEQFARFLSETSPRLAVFGTWTQAAPRHLRKPRRRGEPWRAEPGFEHYPVVGVSWLGASAYCRWAGLRLPTEVEWEKAARGTDARLFPWGDEWHDGFLCWRRGGGGIEPTVPVDAHPEGRSPYGLFQMAGNVAEWCEDWYQPRAYDEHAMGNRHPPYSGDEKVLRGGDCVQRHKLEFRCAMRQASPPVALTVDFTGFRCAGDFRPEEL